VYVADSINDQISENPGEGTDKIIVASYAPLAVVNYFKWATNRPSNVEISQYVDPLVVVKVMMWCMAILVMTPSMEI
jgi:hypothetical protein